MMDDNTVEIPWDEPAAPAPGRWSAPNAAPPPTSSDDGTVEIPWDEPPSTSSDVAKSVAAQGTLGLTDILGVPGTLGQAYDAASRAATKYLVAKPAEYFGLLPKGETAESFMKAGEELNKQFQKPAEQAGNVNYVAGVPLPTGKGVEETVQQVLPFTDYQPQTTAGKYAGSAARFATGMAETGGVTGGIFGGLKTGVTGAVAGAGSEAASEVAESGYLPEWANPYARTFGAVLGTVAGHKLADAVKYVAMPNQSAQEALVKAMAADLQTGHAAMTPEQIQAAIDSGATPTAYDMAGPQTKKVLGHYGYLTNDARDATGQLAQALESRTAESKAALAQHIDDQYGGVLNPASEADAIAAATKEQNNKLYTIARSSPAAQSISSADINALTNIDAVKKAMRKTESIATDPKSGIIVPKPETPDTIVNTGLIGPDGTPLTKTVPGSSSVSGNLNYWDQVKRNIDDQISSSFVSGKKDSARQLISIKNRLVGALDNAVPEYQTARDAAADAFGGQNALEAGYNYFKGTNAFTNQEVTNAFGKMNDAQRDLFARGGAGYLKQVAENQGPDAVLRIMEKPIFADRMRAALGDDTFDAIHGRAQAESLLSKTKALPAPAPGSVSGHGPGFWSAIGAGAAGVGERLIEGGLHVEPTTAAIAGVGALTGLGAKMGFNAIEARIAPKMMEMISDPSRAAELGRLVRQSPVAASTLQKMNTAAMNAAASYYRSNPAGAVQQSAGGRVPRKSGGKVQSGHQHLVDRLFRLGEQAKKTEKAHTEPLLNLPDETVARALDVAQRAI